MLSLTSVKKGGQKKFVNALREIGQHVFEDDLFHYISRVQMPEGVDEVKTVYELLLFRGTSARWSPYAVERRRHRW